MITGYGIITSLGKNKEENAKALFGGSTGIQKFTFRYKDGDVESATGACIQEMKTHPFFENHKIPFDRATQLALCAADECLEDSGFLISEINPLRVGVVIGTSLGGMLSADKFHTQWIEEGLESTDSDLLKQYPLHAITDILAANYGFNGVKNVISSRS